MTLRTVQMTEFQTQILARRCTPHVGVETVVRATDGKEVLTDFQRQIRSRHITWGILSGSSMDTMRIDTSIDPMKTINEIFTRSPAALSINNPAKHSGPFAKATGARFHG